MSKNILIYSFIILIITSCTVTNFHYNRISYYSGNFSPHPELRYLIDINIVDSISTVNYSIGENTNNLTTILSEKQRAEIFNTLKKIQKKNSYNQIIDELHTNGVQLYINDSLIYYYSWNSSSNSVKRIISLENNIKKLLLPLDSIFCSQ